MTTDRLHPFDPTGSIIMRVESPPKSPLTIMLIRGKCLPNSPLKRLLQRMASTYMLPLMYQKQARPSREYQKETNNKSNILEPTDLVKFPTILLHRSLPGHRIFDIAPLSPNIQMSPSFPLLYPPTSSKILPHTILSVFSITTIVGVLDSKLEASSNFFSPIVTSQSFFVLLTHPPTLTQSSDQCE